MACQNGIGLSQSGIVTHKCGTGFFGSIVPQYSILTADVDSKVLGINLGDNQLLMGKTGEAASVVTLNPGSGISITNIGGVLTISSTNSPMVWITVTGTTQALAVNTGYVANSATLCTYTLPTTATVGDTIKIRGMGAGGWKIAQNALQVMQFRNAATTVGATGFISSLNQYDDITLECVVPSTTWKVDGGANLNVV
jgi:hypothetical protein